MALASSAATAPPGKAARSMPRSRSSWPVSAAVNPPDCARHLQCGN